MQYDMAKLEQPLVDETPSDALVWTDIGEAEVEYSIFGNAKVRIYRRQDEVRGAMRWTLVAFILVIGAVWLIRDALRQPEIVPVESPQHAVEVEPATPKPVRVAPRVMPPSAEKTAPPQVQSAPVVAVPLPHAPVVSGATASAAAPAVATKPVAAEAPKPVAPVAPQLVAPVASQPLVPAAPAPAKPETPQPPAASSAVTAPN